MSTSTELGVVDDIELMHGEWRGRVMGWRRRKTAGIVDVAFSGRNG